MAEVDYVLPTWTTPSAGWRSLTRSSSAGCPPASTTYFSPPAAARRTTRHYGLARAHHVARGDTGRYKVIGRLPSYHGSTLATLAAGGHAARRSGYEPLLAEWPKAPWNDADAVAASSRARDPRRSLPSSPNRSSAPPGARWSPRPTTGPPSPRLPALRGAHHRRRGDDRVRSHRAPLGPRTRSVDRPTSWCRARAWAAVMFRSRW